MFKINKSSSIILTDQLQEINNNALVIHSFLSMKRLKRKETAKDVRKVVHDGKKVNDMREKRKVTALSRGRRTQHGKPISRRTLRHRASRYESESCS